ncbi:dCTP deaminase, partial [Candidatus Curtissbacteria bacterium]|nr:dCTP deaminase [Candidatus Curtissbacteria bacterium]
MSRTSKVKKHEEKVMVVARGDLFKGGVWHGIKTEGLAKYLRIINLKHKFLARSEVEDDPRWQQIIPYLVFTHNNKIFLMRRKRNHSDRRLSGLYSIGIGGHINRSDIKGGRILTWAKREFEEEINYEGKYKTKFMGLINDDSNDVGMVHLGLVVQLLGSSERISIKDEHKSGELVGVGEAGRYYRRMETWSQIVYDFLVKGERPVKSNNISSGVLPDWAIADYIKQGKIKIDPLPGNWREFIDQVSIDFHLGDNIKLFRSGAYRFIDTKRGLPEDAMEEINLSLGDPFILEPGAFAITTTREVLALPKDILGRLEGKSSLARLGILVHSTAARFDPGWNGAPVLELGNLGP